MLNKINAIIILYNPDISLLDENINKIKGDVEKIIIIDNSDFPSFKNNDEKVVYVANNQNIGIAAAQNIGLEIFLKNNADYAILFDQDSVLEKGIIQKMASIYKANLSKRIACLGPVITDSFTGRNVKPLISREKKVAEDVMYVSQIIASGKMISRQSLLAVGLMNEDLFIDSVDHEWCWRARALDMKIAQTPMLTMTHTVGDAREKFLGISYIVSSPIRKYYQFRNSIVLMPRGYVPLYWKVRTIFSMLFQFIILSSPGHNKCKEYFFYMRKGILDGINKRMGRCQYERKER